MKIALFHNLPAGGAKRALYEHARILQARGHTLDAYVMSSAAENYLPLGPLCRRVVRPQVPDWVQRPLRLGPLWKVLPGALRRKADGLRDWRGQSRMLDVVEKIYERVAADIDAGGYDIVYVHHCRFLLSPFLLRRLRTPSVYFCQDTLRQAHEWALAEHPDYDSARGSLLRRRVRGQLVGVPQSRLLQQQDERNAANARAATLTLANSWYSREAILRAYGIAARVCYLGVDSEAFRPDPDRVRDHTVLSVGNLGHNKRHDFIIDAVAAIPARRRPPLKIIGYEVIAGETRFGATEQALGPVARSLLCRAEVRGVTLSIEKEVTDEALREAYQQAGVVAFAPYLEPFGFVSLEAMACGTPVVGVCEGGLRESVQDGVTGLLTDRDAAEFGGALDQVLSEPALAARLGAAGREDVRTRWTWDLSTDTLERCFARALGRDAGGVEAGGLSPVEAVPCASR